MGNTFIKSLNGCLFSLKLAFYKAAANLFCFTYLKKKLYRIQFISFLCPGANDATILFLKKTDT